MAYNSQPFERCESFCFKLSVVSKPLTKLLDQRTPLTIITATHSPIQLTCSLHRLAVLLLSALPPVRVWWGRNCRHAIDCSHLHVVQASQLPTSSFTHSYAKSNHRRNADRRQLTPAVLHTQLCQQPTTKGMLPPTCFTQLCQQPAAKGMLPHDH